MKDMNACMMQNNLQAIPQQSRTISGTLTIGNLIMAGWSDQMWRTILNRVLQALSSGPFRTNFQAASVSIL
ncbi:hypothetical protein DICVIV_12874 [Dictyocaulus viviparus]|uniref:Uncharacterized protein n=1 Tax=Dictyocaulus viviparus TaxID=29172 RepID=A0A0D8X9A7_DICVI|nr:hypothetical protein DICVIV_12874 [Dictyocaulus viviparus]